MFASLLCNLVMKTVAVQLSHRMSDIMSGSQAGDRQPWSEEKENNWNANF